MEHPGNRIKHKGYINESSFYQVEQTEKPTKFDLDLAAFRIMKKMRERFGEKPYNAAKDFPDPRKQKLKRKNK